MRYELSDFEWTAIKPLLPNKPRGVPGVNDRRVLNGIFWVLRSVQQDQARAERFLLEAFERDANSSMAHFVMGVLRRTQNRLTEAKSELETAANIPPDDPEVKMALAQLYSRTGDSKKAELMMASLTGGSSTTLANDFFAPALREDANPAEAAHDAEKNLNAIGDQFESGEYDHLDANSFSAMDMVALSWARLGWARFLQGDNLVASQFLDSAC